MSAFQQHWQDPDNDVITFQEDEVTYATSKISVGIENDISSIGQVGGVIQKDTNNSAVGPITRHRRCPSTRKRKSSNGRHKPNATQKMYQMDETTASPKMREQILAAKKAKRQRVVETDKVSKLKNVFQSVSKQVEELRLEKQSLQKNIKGHEMFLSNANDYSYNDSQINLLTDHMTAAPSSPEGKIGPFSEEATGPSLEGNMPPFFPLSGETTASFSGEPNTLIPVVLTTAPSVVPTANSSDESPRLLEAHDTMHTLGQGFIEAHDTIHTQGQGFIEAHDTMHTQEQGSLTIINQSGNIIATLASGSFSKVQVDEEGKIIITP